MASKQGEKYAPGVLRIVLVGKTGCGKSSTGNTILGRKAFRAQAVPLSVTQVCSKVEGDVDGRRVALVDTPGLCDATLPNHVIIKETYKSISLLAPGPHAILLLIQIGRFTKEERDAVEYIKAAFGEDADKYIMVLFTRGDDLEEEETPIEEYIRDSDESLQSLIADCGGRFHVFNNREKKKRTQVEELLRKIDDMVQANGGTYYTSEMLQKAERAIQEKTEEIMKEKDKEIKRMMEKIMSKYEQEIEKQKQTERALKEKNEKFKKEKELRQKEREKRERGVEQQIDEQKEMPENMERQVREKLELYRNSTLELEQRRDTEVETLKKKFEVEARAEAEQNNSLLDKLIKVIDAVGSAAGKIGDVVTAGSLVINSLSAAFQLFHR